MAQVVWTEEARQWLDDIAEYIARDNPSAAKRVLRGIIDRTHILR